MPTPRFLNHPDATAQAQLDSIQTALLTAWSEPHRVYHGVRHLCAVLDALQDALPADAFVLAAWFHDAVYDPTRSDNEEASARWLESAMGPLAAAGLVASEDVRLAARMVRATATPLAPLPNDADAPAIGRFLDADFGIFAAPPDAYDRYVAGVRQEYAFVPDEAFAFGRGTFLAQLEAAAAERGGFFRTSSAEAEARAAANLARERAALGR